MRCAILASLIAASLAACVWPAGAWNIMRHHARFRPAVESVEPRALLDAGAAPAIVAPGFAASRYAVNLSPNADWSTDAAWVDAMNSFRAWGLPDKPWNAKPGLPLSPRGYPLADAGTLSYLKDYPDGPYRLSYRGTATITVAGMGRLAGPITSTDGASTGVVNVSHAKGDLLTIKVTHVDPNDPIRDLRLIRPGADPASPLVFADEFLRRLRPFTAIRAMDWSGVNTSDAREWSDRVATDAFLQTGPGGVAYERMIALANESHKDLWLTLPDGASDDYVRRLAVLMRDSLDPSLSVILEYGNELWNGSFPQSKRVIAAAKADSDLTHADAYGRAGEEAAKRLARSSAIFKVEFADASGRVLPVLCGQSANPYFLECGLKYLAAHVGDPKLLISAIAIAPYVSLDPSLDKPGLTMDGLFVGMNAFLHDKLGGWIAAHKALADRFGVPLIAYEGGQHLVAFNAAAGGPVNATLKQDAQADPRMGALYRDLNRGWRSSGGGLLTFYTLYSANAASGSWGLMTDDVAGGSYKWDAVLSMALPPGDADLDGAVTFDDFVILSANYGSRSRWWEGGDFNGDGVVDDADIALLLDNATGLTADQQAQIAAFRSSHAPAS